MALVNPHTSLLFHNPESKDHNQFEQVDSRGKVVKILEYLSKWGGTQFHVVNIMSNEVRIWAFPYTPEGKARHDAHPEKFDVRNYTRHARTNVVHLLFGNWRKASPEDISRQDASDKIKSDHIAKIEAERSAQKAGLVFGNLAQQAAAIISVDNHNKAVAAQAAKDARPPTLEELSAQLQKAQTQLAAAIAAEEENKKKAEQTDEKELVEVAAGEPPPPPPAAPAPKVKINKYAAKNKPK